VAVGKKEYRQKIYWIRENVLMPIFVELCDIDGIDGSHFTYGLMKRLINKYGKTNEQIAKEIIDFCNPPHIDLIVQNKDESQSVISGKTPIEFYAYYADYDWVVFCQLFGKMIDLPNGFPKYCNDLKQLLESKRIIYGNETPNRYWVKLEEHSQYPKQENKHNALSDARWNKKLYEFLQKL